MRLTSARRLFDGAGQRVDALTEIGDYDGLVNLPDRRRASFSANCARTSMTDHWARWDPGELGRILPLIAFKQLAQRLGIRMA
jgi:hypothetical protein